MEGWNRKEAFLSVEEGLFFSSVQATVLIAMITVGMVQRPVHHVVRVVTMGDGVVAAASSVLVCVSVLHRVFSSGHFDIDGELVLDSFTFDHCMEVAVMQEVLVAFVRDFHVAATGCVLVLMLLVLNGTNAESHGSTSNNTDDGYNGTFNEFHGIFSKKNKVKFTVKHIGN
jgi:type III secretory pathway component EscV